MAALEHSSAQNLGLAERPLCRRPPDRFGSACDSYLFEFVAGKRSSKSRRPIGAIRHRVLATQFGPSTVGRINDWFLIVAATRNAPHPLR